MGEGSSCPWYPINKEIGKRPRQRRRDHQQFNWHSSTAVRHSCSAIHNPQSMPTIVKTTKSTFTSKIYVNSICFSLQTQIYLILFTIVILYFKLSSAEAARGREQVDKSLFSCIEINKCVSSNVVCIWNYSRKRDIIHVTVRVFKRLPAPVEVASGSAPSTVALLLYMHKFSTV